MKLRRDYSTRKRPKQKGVVLVVALIMLVVMTGVGVTMMTGSTLQERMAGNSRQLSVARINAESALRQAEQVIAGLDTDVYENLKLEFDNDPGRYNSLPGSYNPTSGVAGPSPLNNNALAAIDTTVSSVWSETDTNGDPVLVSIPALASSQATQAPRYIIEFIGDAAFRDEEIDVDVSDGASSGGDISFAFRVTAIGYGRDENVSAILQSIYTTGQGSTP